ncbi:hypothetical protein MOO44_01275 (plasmid) [Nicoliella spurrieriana]|uniref:Uncharacterized protein n=1 Tax=Nicoliella spurrieriana TaxID=2925830 RepID=A0A976X4J3_9LACO|nr:hypothetical protein [Nicoliella spurrieriana]UQS85978.1 hypothetical protein MOO44_01275 [Nicoliella spurrieriana]
MSSQTGAFLILLSITILFWGLILLKHDGSDSHDHILMAVAMSIAVIIFGLIVFI